MEGGPRLGARLHTVGQKMRGSAERKSPLRSWMETDSSPACVLVVHTAQPAALGNGKAWRAN